MGAINEAVTDGIAEFTTRFWPGQIHPGQVVSDLFVRLHTQNQKTLYRSAPNLLKVGQAILKRRRRASRFEKEYGMWARRM